VTDLLLGHPIPLTNTLDLGLGGDDQARAPADAEPTEAGLDPTDRPLRSLVRAEDGKAEQAAQEYTLVESRTLVLVAQDRVAALSL
jgi:hypothetical protein